MAAFGADGAFILSPSDLTASAACEYGWLRAIDVRLGRADPLPDDADAFLERVAELGLAHEARELDRLRATHGHVVEIDRPRPYTPDGLATAADLTLEALRSGAPVVAQAALLDEGFGGFADLLVRDEQGRYEVWDVKLARHERVSAVLQLAAYADLLDLHAVPRAPTTHLRLGDRTDHAQDVDDVIPVHRHRRAATARLLTTHVAQPGPVAWGDDRYSICGACAHCAAGIAAHDDVLQVAGLTREQRAKLRAGGVRTVGELAASTGTVPGLAGRIWDRLRAQATLQVEATASGSAVPPYEIVDRAPIDRLPVPDPGDLFFDFEGDPLWTNAAGVGEGLEYLFGVVEIHDAEVGFHPFWAHDRAGEKAALEGFLAHVDARRSAHPGMHIYHYAPYETAALKRLTVRHGVGEAQLDDLLRAGVFVDLYATVRGSLRVGRPSYSIKQLEPLYMGDELRTEDGVTTAADSVLEYHRYIDAVTRGADDEAAMILAGIADYNRYDCVSTWRLRDWLLSHGSAEVRAVAESAEATRPRADVPAGGSGAPGAEAAPDELQDLSHALLCRLPAERDERSDEQTGVALLAAALGYYRREDKPMWWAYFDRQLSPVDEWVEPRGTLVADRAQVVEPWALPSARARISRRTLRLTGRLEPGSTIEVGATVRGAYEDVPPEWERSNGTHREIGGEATVTRVVHETDGRSVVDVEEKPRPRCGPHDQLPMVVFEHAVISAKVLESAIRGLAEQVLASDETELPHEAACDILARRPPRLTAGNFHATASAEPVQADEIIRSVERLDRSYLAVQGPPGTGKTFLGSQVVATLVERGWKIGVVAQSHATVEHFLDRTVDRLTDMGLDPSVVGKKPRNGSSSVGGATALQDSADIARFLAGVGGRALGGTAWTFANEAVRDLDLLVVDEAGQFSLAHTVAVSRAAHRLLLLGDPQQLPQVSRGTHPEPIDASALGWLMRGAETLPAELGYFLARSWRMHSALTRHVSDLAYDGRLRSTTEQTDARLLTGVRPGLHPTPVLHAGNNVTSPEEARTVVEIVRRLQHETWTDAPGARPRPMTPEDAIVVAPYNAQVATIRHALDRAGLTATRVGTVDKFQGQEAAVTIVSLAASSAADVPRGVEFLLDRNRLNVAVSRGMWACYLVHGPALADALPTTVPALEQLGAFLRLVEQPAGDR